MTDQVTDLDRELAEALAAHPTLVRASAEAWAAMCDAQEACRKARDAERANFDRIQDLITDRVKPLDIPLGYKLVGF